MKKEGGSRCVVSGREVVRLGGELISPQIETESYGVFCYFLLCGTLCYPVMVRLSNSSSPYAIVAIAFALLADVVSEHGTQNEIFFRSEMV